MSKLMDFMEFRFSSGLWLLSSFLDFQWFPVEESGLKWIKVVQLPAADLPR